MQNSVLENLANTVWNDTHFQNSYRNLYFDLAQKQLININELEFDKTYNVDLNFLLKSASSLIACKDENQIDTTLRISQYALEYGNNIQKYTACMLLDMLVNQQAIQLAKDNGYIEKDVEYKYPFAFSLSSINRANYYSIKISDEDSFYSNIFQREFWEATESKNNIISISAPTSVGKSYIVTKWLKKTLGIFDNLQTNVAIIVPTRALINQFENDLKKEFIGYKSIVNITTMPFPKKKQLNKPKSIYIFTQERMHIFLSRNPDMELKAVFVDEAHKIGDGERGVLLQSTIEKILQKNSSCKIVFAGPFIKTPEKIFNNAKPIKSNLKTVNQNLFFILPNKDNTCNWDIMIAKDDSRIKIASFKPKNKLCKTMPNYSLLAHHAYEFGENSDTNLIYANDGNQAEKIAETLYNLIPNHNIKSDKEIKDLIELCKETVHRKFLLNKLLNKGVAFHYGSMPQQIRLKIEQLFTDKKIKYLICTSTLIEGVNLSCKNIFIRQPKKGNQTMSNTDLFNLVGRAGRLGKEFYGNVFFIDWPEAPTLKNEVEVKRTTQKVLTNNLNDIITAFNNDKTNDNNLYKIEATLGFLYTNFLHYQNISNCEEVKENCSQEQIFALNQALENYQTKIKLPTEILKKHPITYHYSMQKLFDRFNCKYINNPEYIKPNLSKDQMYNSLIIILNRIQKYFNTGLISTKYAAHITTSWMKYKSLPTIIQRKIAYEKENNEKFVEDKHFNTCVRNVFRDIDQIARYTVPKLLSCYIDVMNYFFQQINRNDLIDNDEDISMYLEYGVDKKTYVSMILLGLSRSTIFKLAEIKDKNKKFILDENLDEEDSYSWLKNNIENIKENKLIPQIQIEEIYEIINNYE